MGLLLKLSLLVATLYVLHVYGYDEENEYRRALAAFRLLQREPELEEAPDRTLEKRTCKARGEGCRLLPKCCGSDHCYWVDGLSVRKDGVCVQCVELNQKCQKNEQCCQGLQCDKGNIGWVDGNCKAKRTSGSCYQDSQCEHECKTGWWPFNGDCV